MQRLFNKCLFFIYIFVSLFAATNHAAACQYGHCWNAVAVGPNWVSGYATDRATAPDAAALALSACGQECQSVEVFDGGCGTIATSRDGAIYFGSGATRQAASQGAIASCQALDNSCVSRVTACSR